MLIEVEMNKENAQTRISKLKEKPMSVNSPVYLYATEMVSAYYSILNIKNKNIMTICGSGDQVLDAFFMGAKSVIGFDLNQSSEFITNLKIAAIKELSYGEYLEFIGNKLSNKRLNYNIYKKIKTNLNKKTKRFFDNLYSKFKYNNNKLLASDNFRQRDDFVSSSIKDINYFLKDKNTYIKMKKILKNAKFKFIQSDIKELYLHKDIKNKKFDIINMSNVPGYITGTLQKQGNKDPCGYFIEKIANKLFNMLSDEGFIFYYIYAPAIFPNKIAQKSSPSASISNFKKFRGKINISKKIVPGVVQGTKDEIVILKRLR